MGKIANDEVVQVGIFLLDYLRDGRVRVAYGGDDDFFIEFQSEKELIDLIETHGKVIYHEEMTND